MHIDDAALAIIDAGRRLGARRLISAGEGNLSLRLDAQRLLVTPAGRRKDELAAADLVVVRLDHAPSSAFDARSRSGLGPSTDLRIHLAIHAARPELGAVVHAHLPVTMALTVAGEAPDPAILPETAVHFPRLPVLPFGEMGSQDLADRAAAAFAATDDGPVRAVILERHGAIALGDLPATAVDRLELIEVLSRTWRDALLVQAARREVGGAGIVSGPRTRHRPGDKEG